VASAPYSELVLPVAGAIEVTSVGFYDGPAAATPNLVTEISQGATAYVQATIQDAFGSSDVNSGCPDGSLPNNNCPLITITDATGADQTPASPANQMTFVSENPSAGSRTYELPFIPGGGMGFDGIWTVEVLGSEGNEQVLTDTRLEAIVVGQPVLTILKSVAGITTPGQVVTYQNNVANTGTATAFSIVLTNSVPQFLAMELNNDLGNWSAVYFLSPGVTISAETFDDGTGTFTYDPNAGACGTAGVDPSPCYDPAIRSWRANIMESMPVSGNLIQRYRAMIE
jgi:uncharacterized repeat protein (TIGR01451 family)